MSFDSVEQLKLRGGQVAVAISSGSFGCHLGIIYSLSGNEAYLVHLAWHKMLRVELFPNQNTHDETVWLTKIVCLPEEVSGQIASLLDALGEQYQDDCNGGIDYGVNLFLSGGLIKQAGIYQLIDGSDGLTCATFVSSIFNSFEIPLVDMGTWEESEKNRAWGEAVLCFLMQNEETSPEHIQRVSENISGFRLRPEEVAAAVEKFSPDKPAEFLDIQARANTILKNVVRECGVVNIRHPGYRACQKEYLVKTGVLEAG
jgi:hypothetical protein